MIQNERGIVSPKQVSWFLILILLVMLTGTWIKHQADELGAIAVNDPSLQKFRSTCVQRSVGCLVVMDGMSVHSAAAGQRIRDDWLDIYPAGKGARLGFFEDRIRWGAWMHRSQFIFPDNPNYQTYVEHAIKGTSPKK